MEELIQIIANLQSNRPLYYIDVINVDNGSFIKKKYTKTQILEELTENETIVDWFKKLPVNEFQVKQWLRNGTTYISRSNEIYINMQPSNQHQPTPTNIHSSNSGLKGGLNAMQLGINNAMYEQLKVVHTDLKEEYKQLRKKTKKLKNTLSKTEQELFVLNFESEKKPLISSETIDKVTTALSGILMKTPQLANGSGLQGVEETLSEKQEEMIMWIKSVSDEELVLLANLYKKHKTTK